MENTIKVTGARQHNLKNVNVDIPKNKLVVVTGPSGSGKSSLAFDTIYAEGQRRYVESLSSYARQFLGMSDKPEVDEITGLSPAISIEQKGATHNPRSTVGTVTEIYDYLRLIFGRAGVPHCPKCGMPVMKYSVDEIVDRLYREYEEKPLEIYSPLVKGKKGEFKNMLLKLRQQGFMRVRVDGTVFWLEDDIRLEKNKKHDIECLIDRMKVRDDNKSRLSEAIEMALRLSDGFVLLTSKSEYLEEFTEKYVCPDCEISIPDIEPRLFSFNNPYGACPDCSGLGVHSHFSEKIAVDPELTIEEGCFIPWKSYKYMTEKALLLANLHPEWDISKPFGELPTELQHIFLYGSDESIPMTFKGKKGEWDYNGHYQGLIPWLEKKYNDTESENVREELIGYQVDDVCDTCKGARLNSAALSVTFSGYNIAQMTEMPIDDLIELLENINVEDSKFRIVDQALVELKKRLLFLSNVGTGYLSLSRRADTLSGGEAQRIRLATQIGSQLTGVMYVLDEPTIGLHPRDTDRLLTAICNIRDIGNSVIVVEHDRDTMLSADYIIELGPVAGEGGGYITATGAIKDITDSNSVTGAYLRGELNGVYRPEPKRRKTTSFIHLTDCSANNIERLSIKIPLGIMTCLTGVSGSGKSTLLYEILYKGIKKKFDRNFRQIGGHVGDIKGLEEIRNVVLVDQSPIGRTPRSNPATYTGVFTAIRDFYAQLPESKIRGYKAGRFSFNVKGGRCEACKGDGVLKVSMLFMPDVYVKCDVCHGSRYNRETLEVKFKGLSIADVLNLTVDEALKHFADIPRIANKLQSLVEAGLGYIRLGQSAVTLSGGEAQRVKLANELGKRFRGNTLYLLDEPTTGLHFGDVKKLLVLLHKLVKQGNTVLMIEHNQDVLASCDYIIDLGPEGGAHGGKIVATGTPEQIIKKKTHTARFLKMFMNDINKGEHNGK